VQIKDFASITAALINLARAGQDKVTDFEVGSVMRTLLEAPAAEIEELYMQMFAGLREAIPAAIYRAFEFPLLEAEPATGTIRVTIAAISNDTLIPAGTIFQRADGAREFDYIATTDTIIPANATFADVPAAAASPGAGGNTAPVIPFQMDPAPLSFVSASSAGGMRGGTDGETEDERQARFREYVSSLQRATRRSLTYGATLAAITDAAGTVLERITSAQVVEPWLTTPETTTPGEIWLYVESRFAAPSPALITRCQQIIDGYTDPATGEDVPGWKAAGVQVEVRAATRAPLDVTATLTAAPGFDAAALRAEAAATIAAYLTELPIATAALRADMIARVMALAGVVNIVIAAPTADTAASATTKIAAGDITIT
jgi:hypothetical protein